jgi:hypothetical protein
LLYGFGKQFIHSSVPTYEQEVALVNNLFLESDVSNWGIPYIGNIDYSIDLLKISIEYT